MRVYKAEREAGLADAVSSSRVIALEAGARSAVPFPTAVEAARAVEVANRAVATNLMQEDLFYFDSVLVTAGWKLDETRQVPVGWNKNDDVFDPLEVWDSRNTPEDKPVNDEHDSGMVVGHITTNRPVLADGTAMASCDADEPPGIYHVETGGVIYKVWGDRADLQERVDKVIAEIKAGQRSVSMECLFKSFDYCLLTPEGTKVVARNKETAFMTKHLRAYGGDGTYEGQRVGRLLRNLVFSGKGIVKRPANPASSILSASGAEKTRFEKEPGYCVVTAKKQEVSEMAQASEVEKLQEENRVLKEQLETAKGKDLEQAKQRAEAQAEQLKKTADEAGAALAAKAQELAAAATKVSELTAEVEVLKTSFASQAQELSTLKADKTRDERRALVAAELKLDAAKAASLADPLSGLSDEQFASHVKAMTAWVTNQPQDGNTNFGGDKGAKTPPKSTDAPVGPKSTDKPAPMAAKADAATADVKVLETPVVNKEPAMAVSTDVAADSVQKSIAAFFGVDSEKAE